MNCNALNESSQLSEPQVVIALAPYMEGNGCPIGFDYGRRVRQKVDLDRIDRLPVSVVLELPCDLPAVAENFLLGLLSASIATIGAAAFVAKFRIEGPATSPPFDLHSMVHRVIAIALAGRYVPDRMRTSLGS